MKIEIDGTWENDRLLVVIDGNPVHLRAKAFKYLVKLAWERKYPSNEKSPGWIYKDNIEVGDNHSRYLFRMKAEIRAAYPSDWKIVENNHMGYYRLIAEPEDITINVDNLLNFPDVEISGLAKTTGVGVCG